MINEQLLDYIRQQLAAGVAKEIIKTALLSQGWPELDIIEGFTMIEKSNSQTTIPSSSEQPLIPSQPAALLSMPSIRIQNTTWTKKIPKTNKIFMIISLLFVFGVDLFIVISNPTLIAYWYIMLRVFAVFAVFFFFENFVFNKKFANSTSRLDGWLYGVILLRNIIFLLNFIPVIQLIFLMQDDDGTPAFTYLVIYLVLIFGRFYRLKR